jgi:hypothetical protein
MIVDPSFILTSLIVLLIISLMLAPFEALGWWAGWLETVDDDDKTPVQPVEVQHGIKNPDRYVVFLTGISGVDGEVFLPEEVRLLELLNEALPNSVIVDDIFPYGVANQALTGQRVFARFWRFAQNAKMNGKLLRRYIGMMINLRNMFQVMVSADRRYGPIYNRGSAQMIVQGLLRHGYADHRGVPIVLLGYSGGGQIAMGSIPYLKHMLGEIPIQLVSLGGSIGDDPGIVEVDQVYHIYGKYDAVQLYALILSPTRWRMGRFFLVPWSRWGREWHNGKVRLVFMGAMKHNGKNGYLDSETVQPDGRSNLVFTVDTIVDVINGVVPTV